MQRELSRASSQKPPPPRTLLPAVFPRPHSQSTSADDSDVVHIPKRRATAVTIACDSCRKAKAKCSGERPSCSRCVHHHLQCRFIGRPGETPSKVLQRDNRSLRDKSATQAKILELLTELPELQAQHVLRRMRAGVPFDTICNQVTAGDALVQLAVAPESRFRYKLLHQAEMPKEFTQDNPYLNTLLHESTSLYNQPLSLSEPISNPSRSHSEDNLNGQVHNSAYLMPFHAAQVIDPLLSDVKPSQWTMVCNDDMLMRDLLGVWLRCEYSFTAAFQKDYFLEDMKSRKTDFCSELLVNAVLAYCCICYPSFSDRAEYWNPQNLTYRFLAEAKRLWELEAAIPRLTTIHAGHILNVFHNLSGLDEIGQAYRLNSISLAHKMSLFDELVEKEDQRIQNGKLFTAWTLYSWEAVVAFSFQQAPQITEPPLKPLPDPAIQGRWYGEIWMKYPSDQHLSPSHFAHLFKAKADFRIIMQRFCTKAYTQGVKVPLKEAYSLYAQLHRWRDELPAELHAKNIVLPAHIQLHVYLHHLVLAIFVPLVDEVLGAELQQHSHPRDIIAEANRYLQTLIRLYYLRHGFEAMDLFIVVPLIYVGLKCLDSINEQTSESDLQLMRTTLMLVVNGLYYQRRNHYLAEVLYRIVRGRMRPEEVNLARETLEIKEDESEGTMVLKQAVRSHWPVSVVKRKEDLNAHMLANLVGELVIENSSS